ncbi:MAG: radical SAM protein, partial [Archaeoglobaceae archaeon]
YASAENENSKELDFASCIEVVNRLADFKVPVILFSGGEPLLRQDIFEIAAYARRKGIKCVLSTNGTLINKENYEDLKVFDYVGVSLDGVGKVNDFFRGVENAFEAALNGLKLAREVTLTGIRFTVTRYNYSELGEILKLARENDIPRFCLYHLVPSGRAEFSDDIDNKTRRKLMDFLICEAEKDGLEILTVDNPADGVYAYLKTKDEDVLEFLKYRGGDGSGQRIICVDFKGQIHPNQFWWDYTAGNILKDDLLKIMSEDELFVMLRRKKEFLKGKCGICKYKEICGGFRVRAYRYGDVWGEDPSCYLQMDEIAAKI